MNRLVALIFLIAISLISVAKNAYLFSYDVNELNVEFLELSMMESMIIDDNCISLEDFQQMNVEWLNCIDLGAMESYSTEQAMYVNEYDGCLNDPFFLGFCCSPFGFYSVYYEEDSSIDEKKSFWFGVIVDGVILTTLIITDGAVNGMPIGEFIVGYELIKNVSVGVTLLIIDLIVDGAKESCGCNKNWPY